MRTPRSQARTALSRAGGLATALLLVSAPAAQAAVSAKDAPSKGDIVNAFPELAGGEFNADRTTKISVLDEDCGVPATAKARSAVTTTGVSATRRRGGLGVHDQEARQGCRQEDDVTSRRTHS